MKRTLIALLFVLVASPILFGQGTSFPRTSVILVQNQLVNQTFITPVRQLPVLSNGVGMIFARFTSTSGSPSGCTLGLFFGGTSTSSLQDSGVTVAGPYTLIVPVTATGGNLLTPATFYVSGAGQVYSSVQARFTCTTFPTSGIVSLEYIPEPFFPVYTGTTITTNTNTAVFSTFIHSLTIGQPGTSETLTLFSTANCTGAPMLTISPTAAVTLTLDVVIGTGNLCITSAGTTPGSYIVAYR